MTFLNTVPPVWELTGDWTVQQINSLRPRWFKVLNRHLAAAPVVHTGDIISRNHITGVYWWCNSSILLYPIWTVRLAIHVQYTLVNCSILVLHNFSCSLFPCISPWIGSLRVPEVHLNAAWVSASQPNITLKSFHWMSRVEKQEFEEAALFISASLFLFPSWFAASVRGSWFSMWNSGVVF